MATRVVKTAGQVAFEDFHSLHPAPLPWIGSNLKAQWEAFAAKHNIQPIVDDVPDAPSTDGELFERAWKKTHTWDETAAEFLRLRAVRDGEPLPVTGCVFAKYWKEWCERASK